MEVDIRSGDAVGASELKLAEVGANSPGCDWAELEGELDSGTGLKDDVEVVEGSTAVVDVLEVGATSGDVKVVAIVAGVAVVTAITVVESREVTGTVLVVEVNITVGVSTDAVVEVGGDGG